MNYEILFSLVGIVAMVGWLALLFSPMSPKWSDLIAGWIVPTILASTYVVTSLLPNENGGGFGSFAEVAQLFTNDSAVMSGWVHFLAFDLVVGAWICRSARTVGVSFWFVVPTLPLTFLFGPAGFALFVLITTATRLTERKIAT
ncbi:MAG: ABA4-like family protein [Pseudomonadota bacterium]